MFLHIDEAAVYGTLQTIPRFLDGTFCIHVELQSFTDGSSTISLGDIVRDGVRCANNLITQRSLMEWFPLYDLSSNAIG